MNKLLLTRREAAELLCVSTGTVESLCKSGQLQSVRVGRNTRIPTEALAEFARVGTKGRTTNGGELHPLWQGKQAQ